MTERKPRIGILGIMQDLYDDMIPGIARRQEGYGAELADSLAAVGEFIPGRAVKYREDAEQVMREFEDSDLDGVLVVMLTYGPAMRVARLLVFFQAEDGIRDDLVTGVQTCALPI